jgi:hypothetical protein
MEPAGPGTFNFGIPETARDSSGRGDESMVMDLLMIVAGTVLFFGCVYEASRQKKFRAFAWAFLAMIGIGMIWSGIVHLAIPTFFSGVPPQ